jgi:hypothetical protein
MGLGQTMITLGMFILLIMTVISANRMLMENSTAQLQTEALASSSLIASDLLNEILSKPFDQQVVIDTTATSWLQDTTGTKVTLESNLSVSDGSQWGVRRLVTLPDSSYTGNYNSKTGLKDIDDYDGYTRIANQGNITGFTVAVLVDYVVYTSPDVPTSTKTWFKRVKITISHPLYLTSDNKMIPVFTAVATY